MFKTKFQSWQWNNLLKKLIYPAVSNTWNVQIQTNTDIIQYTEIWSHLVTTSGAIQYGVPTMVDLLFCSGDSCAQKPKSAEKINTINPLPHNAIFWLAVENIVRKGEIACNKQFLLFSQCFLPYMVLIVHFKCTLKCRLQFVSIWTSLKFCRLVVG